MQSGTSNALMQVLVKVANKAQQDSRNTERDIDRGIEKKIARMQADADRSKPFFDALEASGKKLSKFMSTSMIQTGVAAYRWVIDKLGWMKRQVARIRQIYRTIAAWLGKLAKAGVEGARRILAWASRMIDWLRGKLKRVFQHMKTIVRKWSVVGAVVKAIRAIHAVVLWLAPAVARALSRAGQLVRLMMDGSRALMTEILKTMSRMQQTQSMMIRAAAR